ncbi:MAG: SpoIIE family protein phosphatase [Vicingaceae bacterium]|nr:SpoIIE family protein phosphatase [Vicingaceae bacterium]
MDKEKKYQKDIFKQQYDFEYKQKLEQDSIQTLKEMEITNLKHQQEVSNQKRNTFMSLTGLFIAILIGGILFISIKKTKKKNEELINKNEVISFQKSVLEDKNQEIRDSIIYAKRIQNAILPPLKLVKEYLPQSFILYTPKDIVAGDFYWIEHKNDTILFAAADCTGHGVPGAMVSVVCNNGLNRSVREHGLTDPGKILDKTKEIVIQEFEKSDEDVKDGMDISLCSLKFSKSHIKLQWAGANNPLWIIRPIHSEMKANSLNNGFELLEYKGDKQPIGKYSTEESFTTHSIELQKGDSIYVFTDGFADQFGGEKGKKLMYKPFKELLLSIQESNMDEQKEILEKYFESWKGTLEQVDDVCIIGVRI